MQFRSPFRRAILSALVGILLGASAQAHSPDRQAVAGADTGAEQQFLRPFAVAGEIVDEHANPAPGVTITILSHAGEAITDELGRYIIDTRIPLDADSISLVASLPDERTGQRITTHTASIEHDDPFLDAGVLEMRSEECEPSWAEGLFCRDGLSGVVNAAVTWDDGTGEALYVAGSFTTANCTVVNRIAKWDGTQWSALARGIDSREVYALTIFDDGTGTALYAGGNFTSAGGIEVNRIAKWDGTQWSALASGIDTINANTSVRALTVFDDGSGGGPALYAGGNFITAGGIEVNHIAKWDGTQWSALASGIDTINANTSVFALTVFDDGTGDALYAGGNFITAGGVDFDRIAKWDGTEWSALGNGMGGTVSTLTVFDDGTGSALYAGGGFTTAGGVPANHIAKWDGTQWSALASGIDTINANTSVFALTVFDDGLGGGSALYAGGLFTIAGGVEANNIAKWDGTQWSPLGSGMNGGSVRALTVFDDGSGSGPAFYAGGGYLTAGDATVNRIAKWDGTQWSALGTSGNQGVSGSTIAALTIFDDGSGPALYVGGIFDAVGNVPANNIARWDGTQWSALGPPESQGVEGGQLGPAVHSLAVFDDGEGPALYVGGRFIRAGGDLAPYIAKWDGTQWSTVGPPENPGVNHWVWDFAVFDDGTGEALYVAGHFTSTRDELVVNHVARWDGSNWSALSGPSGTGVAGGSSSFLTVVTALTVFDDGTGEALYAGGDFTSAGGVPANSIARWDGTEWSALGSPGNEGLFGSSSPPVWDLTVFDDGTGEALYAGGEFTVAGSSVIASRVAKWDGTAWSALGPAENPGMNFTVWSFAVFDDGSGSALYAGGFFATAGGIPVSGIARWDGTQWSALEGPGGVGANSGINVLGAFTVGADVGPALYAGGNFTAAGGVASHHIAKWQGCATDLVPNCPGDITGDGTVGLDDFAILASNFGTGPGATLQDGDLNGDGFVDLADFNILAVNFGNDCN